MPPQKIAVLGGGISALSAVYAITEQEGWADRYDITVHQLGWRLGGKGASGRDLAHHDRIYEHGYHMLFGFYENTFATMRRCYEELGRDPSQPISSLIAASADDEQRFPGRYAFHRQNTAVLQQQLADGSWHNLTFDFPENTDLPGDAGEMPHAIAYIEMAIEFLVRVVGDVTLGATASPAPMAPPTWWERLEAAAPHLIEGQDPRAATTQHHRAHLEFIRGFVRHLSDHHPHGWNFIGRAIEHVGLALLVDLMRAYLRVLWLVVKDRVGHDWASFRLWTASDFVCSTVIGLIQDDVIGKGFDSVDDQEYWQWVAKHGTVPEGTYLTIASCWMQSAYDSSFAYVGGDTTAPRTQDKPLLGKPTMGAGTVLRGAARLGFTYKGAMAWKFQTGCGEAMAAPLYEVLTRRGVKFEFFSKVQHLGVDGDVIDRIDILRQVELRQPYAPLVEIKGVPCWPSEPLWDQIASEGARGQDLESDWTTWPGVGSRTLRRGDDFDHVILAISLGALPRICSELIGANPAWRAMVDGIPTVRTQAMQLWVNKDLAALGWTGPNAPVGTGVEPMDTWSDMGQLTDRETWPAGAVPEGVSYFCCAMPDDPQQPSGPDAGYAESQVQRVRETAVTFLDTQSSQFWPAAHTPQGFDWNVLVASPGAQGDARLDEQFLRASIDASDRYVLSPPGTAKLRLRADESGFRNLTLAGDWTENTINAGCMEATVMSGLAASRAITGQPAEIPGEEDFGKAGPKRGDS